mgnify:CR=1 FL=1
MTKNVKNNTTQNKNDSKMENQEILSFDQLNKYEKIQTVFYHNNPSELEKIKNDNEKKQWLMHVSLYEEYLKKKKNILFQPIHFKMKFGIVDLALIASVTIAAVLLLSIIVSLFHYYLY